MTTVPGFPENLTGPYRPEPDGAAISDPPLQRARSLRALLNQHSAAQDEASDLSDEVLDALHEQGMFGLWVPAQLGGYELDPVRSLEVIEALAYGDASSAWVTMAVCLATGAAGAYLPGSTIAGLFDGNRFPVIAGQGTRPGRAVPAQGGYLLSGAWSFGSGLLHSRYIHTLGTVEGRGETRIFIVPVEKAKLDLGSWNVMGLRATASIDYTLDSVFVPAGFTYVSTTTVPVRGGAFYALGISQFALLGHCGWALGVGRRLLDELSALAVAKAGRTGAQAASEAFQSEFALAEAKFWAARSFVFEAWGDLSRSLYQDGQVSIRQQTLIRLALYNVTWSSKEISDFVYRAAGTIALRNGDIQRYFRDMNAGTQHVTSSPAVLQACGRELAGLAAGKHWVNFALADDPAG